MSNFDVEWSFLSWSDLELPLFYQALRLRQEVFVVEQNCPFIDADNLDPLAHHLMGSHEGNVILYTRIFKPNTLRTSCVISRVVVSPQYRGRKLGYLLMNKSHEYAYKSWKPADFFLSAQSHLRRFYENLGYQQVGEGYLEDDIPHIPMLKRKR